MQSIESQLKSVLGSGACVIGVGNRLRGDDGIGSRVAGQVAPRVAAAVVDGGVAPENHLEKIARMRPETVVVIDAADFGGRPGEMRFVAAADAKGGGLSTHAVSLDLFARYLEQRAGSRVFLVAVQAVSAGWEESMSAPVAAAAERLVDLLVQCLPGSVPDLQQKERSW